MSFCLDPFQQHMLVGKQEQFAGSTSGICFELFCVEKSFHGENKSHYNKSQRMLMGRYSRGGKQIGE